MRTFGGAELDGMDLSQEEVDAFVRAEKVARAEVMTWEQLLNKQLHWASSVEVDGVIRGAVRLLVSALDPRDWNFKLELRAQEVYMLHVAAPPQNHKNPPNCPPEFDRRVKCLEHEHVWIERLGTNTARALPALEGLGHAACFRWFCQRVNLTCPDHRDPFEDRGFQMGIPGGGEGV